MKKVKIIFFGTPTIADHVLQMILKDDAFEVCAVVCNPDAPKGRSATIQSCPVKLTAISASIPVFSYESLRDETMLRQALRDLSQYHADYFVVVAYGTILPEQILTLPSKRIVNMHASLLPQYRGASPIHQPLLNGDTMTGVTIQVVVPQMDTGDILSSVSVPIDTHDTFNDLYSKLTLAGGKLLIDTLLNDFAHSLPQTPQDHDRATYCKKVKKEDGHIDPRVMTTDEVFRRYRAYFEWPKIFVYIGEEALGFVPRLDKKRLILHILHSSDLQMDVTPGTFFVHGDKVYVRCINGVLEVLQAQVEGASASSAIEMIRGQMFVA